MASKDARRIRSRTRTIECLEDRRVMSADSLLGGSIQQHLLNQPPELTHHDQQVADFWIDSSAERDVEALVGDVQQTLASAHNLAGWTQARNDYGFLGAGQTVAVIDSGIAWDHAALGGGLGANYRVVGGWDFTEENDANPYDDGPSGSHGTHVAGIVGANRSGTNDDGVAPGVDFVGLRVFNDAGEGYFSWVENALRWVHQNRNAYENPITAVNLSLGTSWNSNALPSWTTLEDEFAQLKADGIFVAVSAGNSFTTFNAPGLSYPAASPYVVPVMSVNDSGALSSFSQRHTRAIAAPGRYIVSTVPDYAGNHNGITDDYASFSGTSMAAPYIAGASVVLREAMQFVGYTNISQDTIFNHMMATATSFFDAATSQTYKRINLANAFNALMPTDEYGSTVATAHNLGTLSGTSEVSGLIGKLSDSDYFRFTASASGSVSFTADTTHGLAPAWTATSGSGAVSGAHGETYTFQVVAGQSYTIGLATSGGIGHYDLAIEADSAFNYIDWGTVTQSQVNNISNAGTSWYRVRASQSGYLSAEAFFGAAGGNVDVSLHNINLQLLASGTANASGERVDFIATAGADYFLKVVGTNADVDFRLTNLVSQTGTTVNVAGTSAADSFSLSVGATQHSVAVNGATYQFNKSAVSTINFAGNSGADSITMTGTAGNEIATLRFANSTFVGAGFSASVLGVETVIIYGGGGNDRASFYDTAGNDVLETWADRALMTGSGYAHDVRNFAATTSYASSGQDRVSFNDGAGDDTFAAWSTRATMKGGSYFHDTYNFDLKYAYASQGVDRAYFYDAAGNDSFTAWSNKSTMTGGGYYNEANGFEMVNAYSTLGTDKATFYGGVGDDTYAAWSDRAVMSGTGYCNDARGFDQTCAYASQGNDRAVFYDTAGDDTYAAWNDKAVMYGAGYNNEARNFARTFAYATQGYDVAAFYDTAGHETYTAWSNRATMQGSNFLHEARGFDRTTAYATFGNDTAIFYDSAGNDVYTGWATRAIMYGNGYYNDARGFDTTVAYSTTGNDLALLRDSSSREEVRALAWGAFITDSVYRNEVRGFDGISVFDDDNDSSDLLYIDALDYVLNCFGNWTPGVA